MRRPLGQAFLLGLVVGILVALIRRASRPAGPTPPGDGEDDGSGRATPDTDGPHDDGPRPEAEPVGDALQPTVDPVPAPSADQAPAWVPPGDHGCPDCYPVKAKEASGIFHVPGGLSYERTRPDRCYPTPEAAAADGFRPAKR